MALTPKVQQDIAWAAIKTHDLTVCSEQGDVSDAPQVEYCLINTRLMKCRGVKSGDEGCALATGSYVAVAEIVGDINPGQFSKQGSIQQLDGITSTIKFAGSMAHGLPVGTQCAHIIVLYATQAQQAFDGVGISAAQIVGSQARAVQLVWAGLVQCHHVTPKRRRKRLVDVPVDLYCSTGHVETHQHGIHTVE